MKPTSAILAVSAFAITAFAIVESGRMQPAAFASVGSTGVGGFTMITSSTGEGPDESPYETLYILDNRGEMLFVYGIDSAANRKLVLRGGASLPALFRAARGG